MRRAAGAHVRSSKQKLGILKNSAMDNEKLAPSLRSAYVKTHMLSAERAMRNHELRVSQEKLKTETDTIADQERLAHRRRLRRKSMQRGESPRTGLMPSQTLTAGSRSCSDYGLWNNSDRVQEYRKLSDYGLTPPIPIDDDEHSPSIKLRRRKTWREHLHCFRRRFFSAPVMRKASCPPSVKTIPESEFAQNEEKGVLKKSITFCDTTKERLRKSFKRSNVPSGLDEQSEKVNRRNSVFVKRGSVSMEPIKKIDLEQVYTVNKQLGTGRFGYIKLAEHKQSKQKIAIKFFPRPQIKQVDFIREYNYSFFLSPHQHIIDTYEGMFQASDDSAFFFVQEFCPRASLREAVEATNQQGIGESNTKKVFAGVMSAIEFMHNENLVHRNLKAENILLFDQNDYSKVKVTDFGLTRKVDSVVKNMEFHNQYQAPELVSTVVKEALTVNRASDVWALGIIFFYCIRGKFPWQKAHIMVKSYWEWEEWLKGKSVLPKKWTPFSEKALKLMKKTLGRQRDRWTAKDMRKWIAKEKLLKSVKTVSTTEDYVYHSTEFGKNIPKSESSDNSSENRKKSTLQHWISTTLSTMAEISEQVVSARDD